MASPPLHLCSKRRHDDPVFQSHIGTKEFQWKTFSTLSVHSSTTNHTPHFRPLIACILLMDPIHVCHMKSPIYYHIHSLLLNKSRSSTSGYIFLLILLLLMKTPVYTWVPPSRCAECPLLESMVLAEYMFINWVMRYGNNKASMYWIRNAWN